MEGSLYEPSVLEVDVQGKAVGVWVSCVEIYNEFIYDLFAEIPTTKRVTRQKGKGSQPQRHALRLAEDKNHNVFIKGQLLTTSSRALAWAYANVFSGSFGVLLKYICTFVSLVCMCVCVCVCVVGLNAAPKGVEYWCRVPPMRPNAAFRDFPCTAYVCTSLGTYPVEVTTLGTYPVEVTTLGTYPVEVATLGTPLQV